MDTAPIASLDEEEALGRLALELLTDIALLMAPGIEAGTIDGLRLELARMVSFERELAAANSINDCGRGRGNCRRLRRTSDEEGDSGRRSGDGEGADRIPVELTLALNPVEAETVGNISGNID